MTALSRSRGTGFDLAFADGAIHEVDLAGLLQARGVFASIRDEHDAFEAVGVDREFGHHRLAREHRS